MAKKADTTLAQEQTAAKVIRDAETYGHQDATRKLVKDRLVISVGGRLWPIRPNGVIDPSDDAMTAQRPYREAEKRGSTSRSDGARKAAQTRRKRAEARSEAARKAAATRKRNVAKSKSKGKK